MVDEFSNKLFVLQIYLSLFPVTVIVVQVTFKLIFYV